MARCSTLVLRWAAAVVLGVCLVLGVCAFAWRGELWRWALDPKQPFQTYRPPAAPDYASAKAWALLPGDPRHASGSEPPVDVFFVHPTTYDGGREWNAPIGEPSADRFLFRVVLPNYAGPFQRVGRVFAPRYRQASLYAAALTLRDDARDARRFAYADVRAAFLTYLARDNGGRPLILAGVGQGAKLAARLVAEVIDTDPALSRRTAAVYLMDTIVPAADFASGSPLPACRSREQARCVLAWAPVFEGDTHQARTVLGRALIWTHAGQLANLGGQSALCVNPLTGVQDGPPAPAKLNRGAANASRIEWGVRPAFMPHQVSARCEGGLLHISRPTSSSLRSAGSWADRRKVAPYNLFYADIEADAQARVATLLRAGGGPVAPPITTRVEVGAHPVHRID